MPIAVAGVTVLLLRSLANKYDYQPFFLALALFALSYAGLGISMYPYIVPQSITIWQAAAPENSQIFMLVGVAVLIPLILGYTAWAYWVFRGKVQARERLSLMPTEPNPRPLRAAPAVVRRALARRRRHGGADFLRPAAVDRAEMRHSGVPSSRGIGKIDDIPVTYRPLALNLPSSWP